MNPAVTVGMAVFNGERFLHQSVESILRQSFTSWKLLIIDDGSTDASWEILQTWNHLHQVEIHRHSTNRGLPATRNEILSRCTSPYLAWLDQDDFASVDRLERQIGMLESDPDLALVGSWAFQIDSSGHSLRRHQLRRPIQHWEIRAQMMFGNPIVFSSTVMRTSFLEQRGLVFRESYGNTLDYDLWERISRLGSIHNIPEPLVSCTKHSNQTSQGTAKLDMHRQASVVALRSVSKNSGLVVSRRKFESIRALLVQPRQFGPIPSIVGWNSFVSLYQDIRVRVQDHALAAGLASATIRVAGKLIRDGRLLLKFRVALSLPKFLWISFWATRRGTRKPFQRLAHKARFLFPT